MSQDKLRQILVEDDASRFLEGLPEKERRPQYMKNALPTSPETFTEEEREAAMAVFSPPSPKG
jgi:hypothetical protein